MQHFNRRDFLSRSLSTAGLLVGPQIFSKRLFAQDQSANEVINVGVVGLGSRGFNLIDDFLKEADVRIVAVSDPYETHYRDRPWGKGLAHGRVTAAQRIEQAYAKRSKSGKADKVAMYYDYHELCGREDIDAVVIATPDHWHALCTMEALKQGKDVYCEKPVTHLFAEGQAIYREVASRNAIFQTGSQQRSTPEFQQAVNLIRNGVIGKMQTIEVGLPESYNMPQGETTVLQPENEEQYNLWCGPSEKMPLMRSRHHRWWRGHRAFGGGVLMDWIGHHNDIAHWSMNLDRSGPKRVEAIDWVYPETAIYNTPFHYTIHCEYENGVSSTISSRNLLGTKWIGEAGWVHVTRGKIQASNQSWIEPTFNPGPVTVSTKVNHVRNFIDGLRTRTACIADAETGHRSISPGHLGYVSQTLKRALEWDAKTELIVNDVEANEMLASMNYREPWKLSTM